MLLSDRTVGVSLPLDGFVLTTAIWPNYHRLLT